MIQEEIINRVKNSSLRSLDLEEILPKIDFKEFDITNYLYQGFVLKEKDFRQALKDIELEEFKNRFVAVYCSSDAVIPLWAYMLVASRLSGIAKRVFSCKPEEAQLQLYLEFIRDLDVKDFEGSKVVIKGCSNIPGTERVYNAVTEKLIPVVQSLMFGEPCSTVPVYKKPL